MAMDDNSKILPNLDDVLIAFQKSLARVRQKTTEVSKYETEYTKGNRALYMVDSVDVELAVGFEVDTLSEGNPDFVKVNFSPVNEVNKSVLRFSVAPLPLDKPEEIMIILVKSPYDTDEYKLSVISKDQRVRKVVLKFISIGEKSSQTELELKTDLLGELKFTVNKQSGSISVQGYKQPRRLKELNNEDTWFVQGILTLEDNNYLKSDIIKIENGKGK